jgi:hypothetical protein
MSLKIICVYGPGSTGKSTAIRNLVAKKGRLIKPRGDLKVILPILNKKKKYALGVGSEGDTPGHVRRNFRFLSGYSPLRAIVCAARSRGKSRGEVIKAAAALKAKLEFIPTRKAPPSQRAAETLRVLKSILKALP